MTEQRKIQLATEVDATGAKRGLDEIKAGAKDMAQAVGQAGAAASKGIDGIGASAEKLSATQSRVVESIKRQSIGLTEGKAALLEYKAAQVGVADAVTPYIAKIREAEQGQAQLGMSAKATAAALRQVPAQFTDIVTSLQAGQKPMTVLIQQGGQLKDVLGGVGPAARALGGYIASLITPLTLSAAAVAALAFALSEGDKELRAFQNAATLTGNAIGLSASQFTAMRDSISGIAGTKGKAAEVLTEIAQNGRIAGTAVRGIAEAAILMEKATGQAVGKTIEQFADLAKSPAEASAKLNEQYNFLTASVYKQIKALEEQGKQQQAASLAEQTYADALKSRAQTVLESAGFMEKAWRGVTGVAKGAWDAMLGVGRTLSPTEKLSAAAAEVARVQAQIAGVGAFGETGGGAATGGASAARKAALEQELEAKRQVLASAQRIVEIESRNSAEKAEQNRLQQLGIAFEKQGEEFKTKAQRRQEELTKAQVEGQQLVVAGIITEKELRERLNGIRQKFNETTGQSEVAGIRAKIDSLKELNARYRDQISGSKPLGVTVELTEAEKLRNKLTRELESNILGVARAQKIKALADAQELVDEEKKSVAYKITIKGLEASAAALDKQVDAVRKQADAIKDQAEGQETVNANFGKSKTAIEQATLAQLKLQLAEAESSGSFRADYVAALQEKTKNQERFTAALQQTEFLQAKLKLDEAGRVASETATTLELEVSLLGMSQREREKIIAQRRVEVQLAKELADIEKLNLGAGPEADAKREELRANARATAVVNANSAANKVVLDEWQRTADAINNSLTDALLRGFESGKSFAQNLRDTLVNMFKTLVLRPVISAVMSPISMGINSIVQPLVNGVTSGISQYLGLGSNTISAGNLFSGGIGNAVTQTGFKLGIGTNAFSAGGASSGSFGVGGAGGGASGLAEMNAGSVGTGGAASGAGVGTVAAGAAVVAMFAYIASEIIKDSKGEKRGGGRYDLNTLTGKSAFTIGPSGDRAAGADDLVNGIIQATSAGLNDAFKAFGSKVTVAAFTGAYETSANSRGGVFSGGTLSTGARFGEDGSGSNYDFTSPLNSKFELWGSNYGTGMPGGKELTGDPAQLAIDIQQAYIAAIQASVGIVPKIVAEMYTYDGADIAGGQEQLTGTKWNRVYDQAMTDSAEVLGLLPKKIFDLIKGIDPENLSDEATTVLATKIQTLVANVNGFRAIVDALPVTQLKAATFEIASGLVDMSGGLDKFAANLTSYVDNIYSAEEKRTFVAGQISSTLSDAGVSVSAETILNATRAQFRAMVEGQDLATESGQKAYAALLSVSGAFAGLAPAIDDIASNLEDLSNRAVAAQGDVVSTTRALYDFGQQLQATADGISGQINALRGQAQQNLASAIGTAQQALGAVSAANDQAQRDVTTAQATLKGALQSVADAIITAAQQVKGAEDALQAAREQIAAGYQTALDKADAIRGQIAQSFIASQNEVSAAQERLTHAQEASAQALRNAGNTILDTLRQLAGTSAGTGNVVQQLRAQRNAFEALAAKALGGDAEAASKVGTAGTSLIEASRAGSTTSAQVQQDDIRVRIMLAKILAVTGSGAAPADAPDAIAAAQADLAAALTRQTAIQQLATQYGASLTDSNQTLAQQMAAAVIEVSRWSSAITVSGGSQAAQVDILANYNAALENLTDAQDAQAALLNASGTLDLSGTQATAEGWAGAVAAATTAQTTYTEAQVKAAMASGDLEKAITDAAAVGVSLVAIKTPLESLDDAIAAVIKAQKDAEDVHADLYVAGADLVAQYDSLVLKLQDANDGLTNFATLTANLDFSGLGVLDPLGGLLQDYADAVLTLQQATQEAGFDQLIRNYYDGVVPDDNPSAGLYSGTDAQYKQIYDTARAFGISSTQLDAAIGAAPGTALAWAIAHGLPAFEQGTNYVQNTGLALLHQGEAIVPRPFNPSVFQGDAALRVEVQGLRTEVRNLKACLEAIAKNTGSTVNKLEHMAPDDVMTTRYVAGEIQEVTT